MSKLRAVIIGCGRMGAGRDHKSPWLYTHIEAYQALGDRVEVVGFVDRVQARAEWAASTWGVPFGGDSVVDALNFLEPDIVSICTPPSDRLEIIDACHNAETVKGIWCEKPYTLASPTGIPTQVNYIRRFDPRHQVIAARRLGVKDAASLIVISALDIHTTSHFSDLVRFWSIDPERLVYVPFHGPSLYILREPGPTAGRYAGWKDEAFTGGGVETGFMERALGNLLDHVESGVPLISPANEDLVEDEGWASEMIQGESHNVL